MIKFEKSIFIKTSSDEIWKLLVADRLVEWQPYMKKMKEFKYLTDVNSLSDKYQVGKTMLFGNTCHYEILESIKNERLKYRAYESNFLGDQCGEVIFSIKQSKDECELIYAFVFDFPNRRSKIIYDNYFFRKWLENRLRIELEILKGIIEKKL
ncbi:MAG: hypothetical protein JEZ08_12820 [Clostridiales bacterium]|nr:hypothetical protein [Clostridiales bacterium]